MLTTKKKSPYTIACLVILAVLAFLFIFPVYWIITGSFKTATEINSASPTFFPQVFTLDNYRKLFAEQMPLFQINLAGYTITGPAIATSLKWLLNTIIMAVASMILTCLTAAMAGYVLAKKQFYGRALVFSLMVCAMALPKQVILIPLVQQMAAMGIHDTLLAVILPIVGWPFGVFLMKQFSENVPTEMLEAARIDGAGQWRTFAQIVFPLIKPGVGALAIFTFITSWNDYFMQLIMLISRANQTISVGIALMQSGPDANDFGLIMAGAAVAAVPILAVFIMFQRYFTQGITMGAVKG